MRFPWVASHQPSAKDEVEEARETLQALFSTTNHVALPLQGNTLASPSSTAVFPTSAAENRRDTEKKPSSRLREPFREVSAANMPSNDILDAPPLREVRRPSASSAVSSPVIAASLAAPETMVRISSWKALPPCPIEGYHLTEEGLVDAERPQGSDHTGAVTNPHRAWWWKWKGGPSSDGVRDTGVAKEAVLSPEGLRSLIRELQYLEQEAKQKMDDQLPDQVRYRSLRGLELAVNPCLLLAGIYLMAWKSPRLFRSAMPRHSIILTNILALMRWRLSVKEKEEVARRHRRLLQATNLRVALTFTTGTLLTGFALWTRPRTRDLNLAPEAQQGQQVVAYYQHTSAALKWMWCVYYHHPAYAASTMKK